MNTLIGIFLPAIFTFLSGLHFYWGLGGKGGIGVSVPTNKQNKRVLNPGPLACFVVGLVLLAMDVFILAKVKMIGIPLWSWLDDFGLCAISVVFILRAVGDFKYVGFFKRVKGTNFANADTRYFSPLCVLISLLVSLLQLNK
ncbi:DUF3995 domain-containing protein [Mucilaginibacter sp. AW1-3]